MDRVAQLRKKEEELEKVSAELERLKKNKQVQKELAFHKDLEALLKKHGKTLRDLPKAARAAKATRTAKTANTAKTAKATKATKATKAKKATKAAAPGRTRRKRKLKTYINPHTGEKIQTRGGNHKILKSWKADHGSDEVESWVR